jgi:predicted alpha/beta hydrolase family esterase
MKNVIILHGTLGSPEGNWFRWLEGELQSRGLTVWLPQLPHAEQPSLREWANFVPANCPFALDEDTLIVGHSSGAILALILAQESQQKLGGIVAVSAFHDNSLGWEPNDKLFDVPFDWPSVRQNAGKLLFVISDTDPYVPLEQAKYIADNCQAELQILRGQGHFNLEQSPNYRAFPKLIDLMEEKGFIA